MFGPGRRFARRFGGGWEGGGPPWMQQGPGPWGFRGPFGPGQGPHGHGHGPGHWGVPPEMQALWSEAAEVGRLFAIASRSSFENKENIGKLRSILDAARKGLTEIIYKEGQTGQTPTSDGPGVEQA